MGHRTIVGVLIVLLMLQTGCKKSPPVEPPAVGGAEDAVELPSPVSAAATASLNRAAAAEAQALRDATVLAARGQVLTPGYAAIPPGRFTMGRPAGQTEGYNDATPHEVSITRPLEMKVTEVTVAEYRELMATTELQRTGDDDAPVAHTSWYQAVSWCNELSRRRRFPPCYTISGFAVTWSGPACAGYRLPTEAEWEYAARAGSSAARYADLAQVGWYDENSGLRAHPGKQKRANAFGLYDMLGNMAEWVWDWHAEYPTELQVDPTGPRTGDNRVFRGGSFQYGEGEATAWGRAAYGPPNQVPFIGFRCVRTLSSAPDPAPKP